MRVLLSPEQMDRRDALYAIAMVVGFVGVVAIMALNIKYGILSSFAAVYLGATSGAIKSFRTERGLWLIAGFFVCVGLPIWTIFVISDILPRLRGTIPMPWQLALDASACTMLWGEAVRLALSAGLHNFRCVRPRMPRFSPWS